MLKGQKFFNDPLKTCFLDESRGLSGKIFENPNFLAKIKFYCIFRPLFSKITPKFSKMAPTAPNFWALPQKSCPPNAKISGGGQFCLIQAILGEGNAPPLAPLIFAPASAPKSGSVVYLGYFSWAPDFVELRKSFRRCLVKTKPKEPPKRDKNRYYYVFNCKLSKISQK